MKVTSLTLAAALFISSWYAALAADPVNPLENAAADKVITSYLEATTLGHVALHPYLFADDFEYSNSTTKQVVRKKEYTAFLAANNGLRLDCKTSYALLDQSGKACIAKVTMAFPHFTRVDYVTLRREQDGWKVSKVVTTYP